MNKTPKWNFNVNYKLTQWDKLAHILVSEGVAGAAKAFGTNKVQAFLISFFGFGLTKEILDSYTHYGDVNDLISDAIGAFAGSFLNFDIKF